MGRLKGFGFAALIALALTATMGAATASASVFVADDEYPANIIGETGKSNFYSGLFNYTCENIGFVNEKELEGATESVATVTNEDGTCVTASGEETFEMNGCQFILEPGERESETTFSGKINAGPAECGPIEMVIEGFGCYTNGMTIEPQPEQDATFTQVSGEPDEVEVEATLEMIVRSKQFPEGCGTMPAFLDIAWQLAATNQAEELQPLHVAPSGTVLCEAAESPCAYGDQYGGGTELTASASDAKIEWRPFNLDGIELNCASSGLEGVAGLPGDGALDVNASAWTLAECDLAFMEEETCTVTAENQSFGNALSWSEGTGGILAIGAEEPLWHVECENPEDPTLLDCSYGIAEGGSLSLSGGNPATLTASKVPLTKTPHSEEGCVGLLGKATFSGSYSVSAPQPAYVASGSS